MDDAIADFGQAIRIRPNFPEAYFYRGNAHAVKREFELAIADYDAALRLKPDFAQAFYNRAFLKTLLRRAAAQARLRLSQ
jgi:lipoprotein NlpI